MVQLFIFFNVWWVRVGLGSLSYSGMGGVMRAAPLGVSTSDFSRKLSESVVYIIKHIHNLFTAALNSVI